MCDSQASFGGQRCAACDKVMAGPWYEEFLTYFSQLTHIYSANPDEQQQQQKRPAPSVPVIVVRRVPGSTQGKQQAASQQHFMVYPPKPTETIDLQMFERLGIRDDQIPDRYTDKIMHNLMTEPVILSDGFTYDESTVAQMLHVNAGKPFTSPIHRGPIMACAFRNFDLKEEIRNWVNGIVERAAADQSDPFRDASAPSRYMP
jgi:hypothetical protein